MELIGRINRRKIYYIQVRKNDRWKRLLPNRDWALFTIANKEDEELIAASVSICLDNEVASISCAGELANWSENYFDEEISWRRIDLESKTNKEFDYEKLPFTTAHTDFNEGFWFASTLTHDTNFDINKVVCLDFTNRKVKDVLIDLISKINNGWLPSEKSN